VSEEPAAAPAAAADSDRDTGGHPGAADAYLFYCLLLSGPGGRLGGGKKLVGRLCDRAVYADLPDRTGDRRQCHHTRERAADLGDALFYHPAGRGYYPGQAGGAADSGDRDHRPLSAGLFLLLGPCRPAQYVRCRVCLPPPVSADATGHPDLDTVLYHL